MALIVADRVKQTSTTAGTGTLTLNGTVTGFQSFAVIGNANTTYYAIVDNIAGTWEVGIGTYTSSGTTLSRDTVLSNSSGTTAKITFAANSKDVFVTYPASKAIYDGGPLGTPLSGTVTNLTGTASININGTVGATTADTGAFTSVTSTSAAGVLTRAAATQDGVELIGRAGGTTSLKVSLTPTTLTASRTLTAPDNSGTILTTGATVTVAQGGTGQTTYTNGQLLIGNTTGNTLAKSTLTAGTGISVTNGAGTITIASTVSGTVTSVSALTLGTTGTDLSSTVANSTTTPVITLNVPTASATNRGALSAADWTTFNNKTSNTGTVTSVGGTGTVSGITLTGTVTTTGNLTLGGTLAVTPSNFASQTANTVLAAPNGTAGVPTFRALAAADIPTLNQNTTGTAANVTGTVIIANGGTGATTAATALTNLGAYAASNPAGYTSNTGTVTSVGQSFTGGLISVSGSPVTTSGTLALTVAGTSGGIPYFSSATTWATSAALAANALVVGGGAGVAPATVTTGTGVVTALGVSTGTAGSFVVNGGVLGTPSSGTVTNLTGTASININGTVGATTANSGAFTTLSATGVTTVQAGTAAAPAITTSGDTNTGIFFPAADTIAFAEGGVESVRITSAGFVGIGITVPTCAVDVVGGIKTSRTSVTSPATTDGNVFSGTYTPTLTNTTNISSSTASIFQYMRVGNVLTVSGAVAITPSGAGAITLGLSLPIASAITNTTQCSGVFASNSTSETISGRVSGDVANDRATLNRSFQTLNAANFSVHFTYLVL